MVSTRSKRIEVDKYERGRELNFFYNLSRWLEFDRLSERIEVVSCLLVGCLRED